MAAQSSAATSKTENKCTLIAQLTDVIHRYDKRIALDVNCLSIPSNCITGVIGPDGVGKSTLLGLVAGAKKMQVGEIEVLGGDINNPKIRRNICPRIAYMPQGLGKNLYAGLSVYENVDFFGRLFGQSRAEREYRVNELLEIIGLARFSTRLAGKLSGGMKQKLGLCCALIHDPELLILDEPTTGVDPLSRRQFWEFIERIRMRRKKMGVIVATAYMEEANKFDNLIAMDAGKVLVTCSPAELKQNTGKSNLDAAFIELLSEEKRHNHKTLQIPSRSNLVKNNTVIEAKKLTKKFGDFTAVSQVSFNIERGEIFGFLGSNGCGKTTTMKMLTGLLPCSEGEAFLLGSPINARDIDMRKKVGFMTQSFSLYAELTVKKNLELHARLFHLPANSIASRVNEMIQRFSLEKYKNDLTAKLPLGIRQRLSLAVAIIHDPEVLILDEPTSGVDPIARDSFWELLIKLSRENGVTIFISTHFMNEAERCDRISLMHAGKVLAQDTPEALIRSRDVITLEEAFVAYLMDAGSSKEENKSIEPPDKQNDIYFNNNEKVSTTSLQRMWAYAHRESIEIRRDFIRLAFALLGPIILMLAFGYGISFDVEKLPYAVLDRDNTIASRAYLEQYSGSRYFDQHLPIKNYGDLENRLRSGELKLAIEIPPHFGKKIKRAQQPEVGVWIDGAMPFDAETSRGYVEGIHHNYLTDLVRREKGQEAQFSLVNIESRFRYNQDFKSVIAMVPGIIMLLLVLIPSMMTAVAVVREKELGSISNLYSTPVTKLEFLLGKQVPYVVIAMISFISLVLMAIIVFQVPIKGSIFALTVGALFCVIASTAFGLLISTFVKTQIAAIFSAAILSIMPTIQFSGFLSPVSSLSSSAQAIGYGFPSSYFQKISVGTFTKAMDFSDLYVNYIALTFLILAFISLSWILLKNQDV